MKSKKPTYDGIVFDSNDEVQFYKWCQEAVELGVIVAFEFHPDSIEILPKKHYDTVKELKTKTKIVEKHLMASLSYTPDFIIWPNTKLVFDKAYQDMGRVYVDVKPAFNLFKNSSKFSVVQKILYHVKGIYVHKVVTEKFFKSNGVPSILQRVTKAGIPTGKWKDYATLSDLFYDFGDEEVDCDWIKELNDGK